MSQAHDAASGVTHSHKKHYLRIGAILTVVTAIELALPLLKNYPQIWEPARPLWAPALIILSIAKFGAVVGEFMHLRGDRTSYYFLFISPLMLATTVFVLLSLLSVVMFRPFGAGYAVTAEARLAGYVEPSTGPAFEQPLDDAKFAAAFDGAKGKQFADGKKVFGEKCQACHGAQGGGIANLGLNLTDDCYKYGGSFKELYLTIGKGQAGGKMPAWAGQLKGEEIRQVMYYIKSLKGTNVAGGQPCVGDKVP